MAKEKKSVHRVQMTKENATLFSSSCRNMTLIQLATFRRHSKISWVSDTLEDIYGFEASEGIIPFDL